MDNWRSNGIPSSLRSNNLFLGHAPLPPRILSPIVKHSHPHCNQNPNDYGSSLSYSVHMPRSSSTNVLLEEQPSWVDDLLNDPESPVQNVLHRRSSSDSFTYLDTYENANDKSMSSENSRWGLPNQQENYDLPNEPSAIGSNERIITSKEKHCGNNIKNFLREVPNSSSLAFSDGIVHLTKDAVPRSSRGTTSQHPEGNMKSYVEMEAQSQVDSCKHNMENREGGIQSSNKPQDFKHVKQHNARRSRVRKLQYIAELESRVQLLQADGSGVSAELKYLNQHYLILVMENRVLKQWFESLSQLQLIKSSERDLLEKELERLQFLYQHQQQVQQQQGWRQQQPPEKCLLLHKRATSLDTESRSSNTNLKPNESGGFRS